MKTISIAKEFTPFPGGRIPEDGPHSGQEFRENFLVPILNTEEEAEVVFDGAWGYGSSFLEEAFGGLVRLGIPKDKIFRQIKLVSKKESIIDEVMRYINAASEQ